MAENEEVPKVVAKKESKAQKVKRGAKRNSESLGVSLSVVATWLVTDVLHYDVPMEVMGAILTSLGIVAARFRDDLF